MSIPKQKKTSALIRVPCYLAETVADKSLKIALTVADPLVKPLRGPARAIDDFAAEKLLQFEAKYPVLTTPTEEMLNNFNEKTEPVRQVMNSVKGTTTSTLQHGKETVSNVASATVNKATDVADSVYKFCETHVPGKTANVPRDDFARRTTLLWERIQSSIGSLRDYFLQSIQSVFIWFRMFIVFMLLNIKQINDRLLSKLPSKPSFFVLPQRLLIILGITVDFLVVYLRPDDRTVTEYTKSKQPARPVQNKRPQTSQYVSRQTLKPDAFVTTKQSVLVTNQEVKITHTSVPGPSVDEVSVDERRNLYPHLPSSDTHSIPSHDAMQTNDVKKLLNKVKPTDIELLYARLPSDFTPYVEDDRPLTDDQRILHAKVIGAEIDRQTY